MKKDVLEDVFKSFSELFLERFFDYIHFRK